MNLCEFGLLVKTLRNNCNDDYGNKWTRESLSKVIHLTSNQLGRLERGDRKYLDNQTLQLLADAFKLTNMEKKEFFAAAVGIDDREMYRTEDPINQLYKLMTMLESLQFPAYITDVYADIVASNITAQKIYKIPTEIIDQVADIPAGLNMINFIYSPHLGFREIVGSNWREAADMAILMFRRTTLRYRHMEYFQYLLRELLKDKQFDIDWYSSHRFEEHLDLTYELFDFNHPDYGHVRFYSTETIISTTEGDLYLIIYNPADATTVKVFGEMQREYGNRILRMASWPEKIII